MFMDRQNLLRKTKGFNFIQKVKHKLFKLLYCHLEENIKSFNNM